MTIAANPPTQPEPRWAGLFQASEGTGVGAELPTRSLVFDCLIAAMFFAVGSVFLPLFFPAARPIDYLFVGLVNLPLLLRRRLPRTSFLLIQAFGLAQIWWPSPIGLHNGGMLFSLYSLVGFTNRRTGLVGAGVMLICAFSGAVNDWWNFIDITLVCPHGVSCDAGLLTRLATTTGMIGLVFAAWASGERLRSARLGQLALADRASQLEREREQQARIAAAAERARIAREMHDVIAHALSVMIAQADGAAYVIDADPATAKTALERISGTGRDSLTQMRGLLGLLRSDDGGQDAGSVPQPGVSQLGQLVDDARQAGLQVDYRASGSADDVAQMQGLTVYRVVQEALTNARKHGGDQVRVLIDFRADGVRLEVANDAPDGTRRLQTGAPGHGLQGMRERIAAVGGELVSGPTADGFAVRAWLPQDRASVSSGTRGRVR